MTSNRLHKKPYLTSGQAARRLGLSIATIHSMVKRGEISGARRFGKWLRVPIAEVERLEKGR